MQNADCALLLAPALDHTTINTGSLTFSSWFLQTTFMQKWFIAFGGNLLNIRISTFLWAALYLPSANRLMRVISTELCRGPPAVHCYRLLQAAVANVSSIAEETGAG